MKIVEYADREMAGIDIAGCLAEDFDAALARNEFASLVVPGGTTPGPIFDSLCASTLDWGRLRVMPSDERCVPLVSPRSNAKLISERLLSGPAKAATFLPLYVPVPTPEEALPEIESVIAPALPIDVLLLGMGADMHTASLFPNVTGLAEALAADAKSAAVMRPVDQPEARISLSARVLNDAMSKHLVIFGDDKRAALERAQTLPAEQAPIAAVLDDMIVHWAP